MQTSLAAPKAFVIPTLNSSHSAIKKRYTFREITDQKKLEHFFHLRYAIYVNSRLKGFLKENAYNLDLDIYDLHALHYGLFSENEPIGYLRLVLHKRKHYNSDVLEIGQKYGIYSQTTHAKPAVLQSNYPDFPFLNYPHVPKAVKEYYEDAKNRRISFVEASRLIVLSDFRQSFTSKFLVKCAVTVFKILFMSSKEAVINCIKRHERFYAGYGFSAIANSEEAYVTGSTLTRILLSSTQIPKHLHSLFEEIAEEFTQTGKIIREM